MPNSSDSLIVDIPVELTSVSVVFSIASLSFEGDLPAALFHANLIRDDATVWGVEPNLIVVFHTNAGHPALSDQAYNRDRNIQTGNRFRGLITDLMAASVGVELCGATARAHGWINSDTIEGVKVNTDAMARITQLSQQGYVVISES